ncbi:MAG: FAD-binding oxidoreductase [Pseudanabaenaceae cyanobacterium]
MTTAGWESTPESVAALAALVRETAGWAIAPVGVNSKAHWGGTLATERPVLRVSTAKLNGVVAWAAADLTVTVGAGLLLADLQRLLATQGQFVPLDPPFAAQGTVGGVLATGAGGSLRHRYNGIRDLVLGITFVRADGAIAKAGGRVVKNVAGYDLMKLLTGSWGTLGIVTELTLRVYPLPTVSESWLVWGSLAAVAALRDRLVAATLVPVAVEVLSPGLMQVLGYGQAWGLAVRFDGVAAPAQGDRLQQLAGDLERQRLAPDFWETWQGVWTSPRLAKFGALPGGLAEWGDRLPGVWSLGGGTGLGWLVPVGPREPLRAICEAHGGFLSELAGDKQGDIWGDRPGTRALQRRIKETFDPENRLNPGRFLF